jgi:hypothetical protein
VARRFADAREVAAVRRLISQGLNDCQIARATGIPRRTILDWRHRPAEWPQVRPPGSSGEPCPRCHGRSLDERAYAYLLGLYLGDGCISRQPNGVYKLRIVCADRYPDLIAECRRAIATTKRQNQLPGWVQKIGCVGSTPDGIIGRACSLSMDQEESTSAASSWQTGRWTCSGASGATATGAGPLRRMSGPEPSERDALPSIHVHEPLGRYPWDLLLGVRSVWGALAADALADDLGGPAKGCRNAGPSDRTEALTFGSHVHLG